MSKKILETKEDAKAFAEEIKLQIERDPAIVILLPAFIDKVWNDGYKKGFMSRPL